jgi:hypothetical protein
VPEVIDPVFVETSPERSFSLIKSERIGLVFAKTGSINSGTGESVNVLVLVAAVRVFAEARKAI